MIKVNLTSNSTPLVSIVMLTYNRADYIALAIQSVLDQTYQNWELLILDDGSTDATSDIVTAYTDSRIGYIRHTKNKGLMARRKESLSSVRGIYTAVIDSDDVWLEPTKLAEQVNFLETHPDYVLVGSHIKLINSAGAVTGSNQYELTDAEIRRRLLLRNQFTHSSVVMRTDAVVACPGYRDTTLAEDLDLFLQLGMKGKFANLPTYSTAYRIHTNSFNPNRLGMAKAVLDIVRNHRHNYPNASLALFKCRIRIFILTIKNWF